VTPTKLNGTINRCTLAITITFHDLLNHHQLNYKITHKQKKLCHGDHPIPNVPLQGTFHFLFHFLDNPFILQNFSPQKQSQKTSTRAKGLSNFRCTPTNGNHASSHTLQNVTKIWTCNVPKNGITQHGCSLNTFFSQSIP